ncbi:hypothetical protein AB0L82_41165 [Nocardia sp. NPDC052001]|uniref:hypothetical protein n=1 Tax=Nocardia sp. NPDC052001 TaxID=3154853 RepID=UPI0034389CB3
MKRLRSSPIGIAVLVLSMLASWATGSALGGLVILGVAAAVVFVRALRAERRKAGAQS